MHKKDMKTHGVDLILFRIVLFQKKKKKKEQTLSFFLLLPFRFGIRCNCVLPGFISTPMTDKVPEKVIYKVHTHTHTHTILPY